MSILTTILAERKYGPGADIPVITGPIYDKARTSPVATPLADLLAASYADGKTDAAGADAAMMSFEDWIEQTPVEWPVLAYEVI